MAGEAADVHLVDDRVPHRPAERLVAFPVVVMGIDDNTAHGGRNVVPRTGGIVANEALLGVAQGVGVDQHLVAVEAKPSTVKIFWPIDTVCVMSAGLEVFDIDVPEEKGPVVVRVQLEDLNRLGSQLSRHEQIRAFALLPEPLAIERGELTSTLKLRRDRIEARYLATIDEMYQQREQVTS